MAFIKCKMCGGDLDFVNGESVGVCQFCGTKQTLPKQSDEKTANLYERAGHLRRSNEFDKAMSIYEQILNEDPSDAEAYWSIVLCRYGIQYVEEPATGKRIPTVNRTQRTSIFDDAEYKAAISHADASQRQLYEEEATLINDIQRNILLISQNEKPFDVFICYKETDENGERTQDSVLATELYYALTNQGYKVFFAKITLENKLGSAYEPYIFAALESSKVMVVMGTKPEYFNAVWVKNEWSRFLLQIKNGQNKMLIPAYRDMNAYDLPEEFSHLQALDMSKLGFMQDLVIGINKIISFEEKKREPRMTAPVNNAAGGASDVSPMLKRAYMFLEDGNWSSADEYCEKVLDKDPENAYAYLGKLLARLQLRSKSELAVCTINYSENDNFRKAMRFGSQELKNELSNYCNMAKKAANDAKIEEKYRTAVALMSKNTVNDFHNPAVILTTLGNYKDSRALLSSCDIKKEELKRDILYSEANALMKRNSKSAYLEAAGKFRALANWRDSQEKALLCERKAKEAEANYNQTMQMYRMMVERNNKKNARTRNIIIAVIVTFFVVYFLLMFAIGISAAM